MFCVQASLRLWFFQFFWFY